MIVMGITLFLPPITYIGSAFIGAWFDFEPLYFNGQTAMLFVILVALGGAAIAGGVQIARNSN